MMHVWPILKNDVKIRKRELPGAEVSPPFFSRTNWKQDVHKAEFLMMRWILENFHLLIFGQGFKGGKTYVVKLFYKLPFKSSFEDPNRGKCTL